ncbi:MAG: DUF1905 domain-containing protein [Candidatus Eisenbacteria bacterium]|nr:DUF1905 domain-containing protein [Candidatus Eisenbacteria bacterium]
MIRRQGPNPYVDVPQAVSRAFAAFASTGRIGFEGTLGRAPIRGTLIPVGRGRHRLYVNGGMRSAAGVAIGDTVSFALRATRPGTVRPPADVAAGLRLMKRARAAFDALSPSHRRELLRYIDDARTPETRQQRIRSTAGHVLGERAPARRRDAARPLWACPRCGNQFVTANMYHSCTHHTLEEPFAGKPAAIRRLFDRFRAMVETCGPVKLLPYPDRVGFMVRVRFAAAVPRTRWLDIGFWLPRRIEHPRFHRIQTIYPHAHVHLVRITGPRQLDARVRTWLREAYAVGCRRHPGRR